MGAGVLEREIDSKASALKPPLKWAGGKRWLVPHLLPIWLQYQNKRLVEPFCGGLAIALGLMPQKALLNDINPHLINFYKYLSSGFTISIDFHKNKKTYYKFRKEFNRMISNKKSQSKKAAEIFYYLNKTGYNGLCRFNSSGEFNVPFGQYKNIRYEDNFLKYKTIFSKWEFICLDFEALDLYDTDFIYADPPYDVDFTQYSKQNFSFEDQKRLAYWLAKHKGPVVVSNQATERIKELYISLGFNVWSDLLGPRRISCDGNRAPAMEILAIKGIQVENWNKLILNAKEYSLNA